LPETTEQSVLVEPVPSTLVNVYFPSFRGKDCSVVSGNNVDMRFAHGLIVD